MITEIPIAQKIARGTLRLGLITSSPLCAMISYPSNAMNVSPIAMITPVSPLGMNPSLNRKCHASVRPSAIRPKITNRPRIATLASVMMLPTAPVSDAPMKLMNVNATAMNVMNSSRVNSCPPNPSTVASKTGSPAICHSSTANAPKASAYRLPATA